MKTRTETDLLGALDVPADARWGIHTARALANFGAGGPRVPGALVRAFALVKKAACLANAELGYLDSDRAAAMRSACDEVAAGGLADQFPLPALQGGAGTSTNMNVNEVLANRALERLGRPPGDYAFLHPLEHVNLHQSTNDVYPTALKVAAILGFRDASGALAGLQGALQEKERVFAGVLKTGRTEWQDAVPVTLGAEFGAWAEAVARDRWRTFKCEERLRVVNLGGGAVGTGLAVPRRYAFRVVERLREVTGLGLARAENPLEQTANADAFVETSGMLKAAACTLMTIACDLRLLHLLGEVRLPAVQAGSSIMPGKVNPVVLEATIAAALRVKHNDALTAEAVSLGTLELSEFLPSVAQALLESLDLVRDAAGRLAAHVAGIGADAEACRRSVERSEALVTAFVPALGYGRCEALIGEFRAAGGGDLRAFLEARLGADAVRRALEPARLLAPSDDPAPAARGEVP